MPIADYTIAIGADGYVSGLIPTPKLASERLAQARQALAALRPATSAGSEMQQRRLLHAALRRSGLVKLLPAAVRSFARAYARRRVGR